jgi:hypothetical protein
MLRFRQFLKESLAHERIQKNVSPLHAFNFAKNATHKMVRWVITKDNKLLVGDGSNFIHDDLIWRSSQRYKGWIDFEQNYYAVCAVTDGIARNIDPTKEDDPLVKKIVELAHKYHLKLNREQWF